VGLAILQTALKGQFQIDSPGLSEMSLRRNQVTNLLVIMYLTVSYFKASQIARSISIHKNEEGLSISIIKSRTGELFSAKKMTQTPCSAALKLYL
jgi:hypothetical protein